MDDLERELELAWAAGFFDGEGCTARKKASGTNSTAVFLEISQNDRRVLDRWTAAVGAGRVNGPYGPRGMWQLSVNNHDQVLRVMVALWPYLDQMKRDQFKAAIGWLYERGGPPRRGTAMCKKPGHTERRWTKNGRLCVPCEKDRNARYQARRAAR